MSDATADQKSGGAAKIAAAMPFWISVLVPPLAVLGAIYGGWTVFLLIVVVWYLFALIDSFAGLNAANEDPGTQDEQLFWYRLITLVWPSLQFVTLYGVLWYVTATDHLALWEMFVLFCGIGVMSGAIGIVYAHELMHQKPKIERRLADFLMAMVLYSHFRSEHLLVHHRYVGTPKDPVTARYGEGFHHFFWRVVRECAISAFQAEKAKLARKGEPWTSRSNPFWLYWALQLAMLTLAFVIGGWLGIMLFLVQAFVAIWQLELINYIEHYGLTRKHLGGGKYEHTQPHHSWNDAHRVTNWFLINLQRHSDHHYKPDRRYPLLQTYGQEDAPQLPYSYPLMGIMAFFPRLWRSRMNPRVRAWRQKYYPEVTDWTDYNTASNPMPR